MTSSMRGPTQSPGHRLLPLKGVRVLELAGLAPVPHCGLLLADFGADVTILDKEEDGGHRFDRGKKRLVVDLKKKEDVQRVKELCNSSDVLLDPYRPGVLEKLGLDPKDLLESNAGLIVCRLTGYGQNGPLAQEAGHDINYTAISGVLPTCSGKSRGVPWPPVNLLADFAGGGLTAAFGVVAALHARSSNGGKGCVLDVSMVEGLTYLASFFNLYKDLDYLWNVPNAAFGGDCPIYRCYETKDGKFVSVGPLEPKFTMNMMEVLGVEKSVQDVMEEPAAVAAELERTFKQKTRDEWTRLFEGKNACVAPVLDLDEAPLHPHHKARDAFVFDAENDRWLPRPHPRMFSLEEYKDSKSKL